MDLLLVFCALLRDNLVLIIDQNPKCRVQLQSKKYIFCGGGGTTEDENVTT